MNILVIDDKEIHCNAAKVQLAGHNVTFASSFDEAVSLLKVRYDKAKIAEFMAKEGFTEEPSATSSKEYQTEYWDCDTRAYKAAVIPFPFEVVLCDLMMPMSSQTLAPGIWDPSKQVAYGFVLALKAAERGARFVAVATDTNHHRGAESAALDQLSSAYYSDGMEPNFTINGAKCMFVHAPLRDLDGQLVKRWDIILRDLTS